MKSKRGAKGPPIFLITLLLFYLSKMIHQRSFLCGHFTSSTVSGLTKQLIDWGWEKGNSTVEEYVKEGYYSSFQYFMFSKSLSQGCYTFCKQIGERISFGKNIVLVHELRLYILPLHVVLFSIEVEQSSESVKDLCSIIRLLRNCRRYGKLSDAWTQLVVRPLKDVCQFLTANKKASYIDLVENSDRMKIMKIVWSDEGYMQLEPNQRKSLLYNLCTADSKTNDSGVQTDETSDYIQKTFMSYSLSVFKQWEALSLPDSFTVLYYEPMPDGILTKKQNRNADVEEYDQWSWHFRILYIYALFQKCCLFKLNNNHLEVLQQKENTKKKKGTLQYLKQLINQEDSLILHLTKEMDDFENHYVFNNISYNTFTMELYKSIFKGMQISQERQEVYRLIGSEQKQFEASNTKVLNQVLFLLSLFTIFSAILDASQLFDNILPFDMWLPHKSLGYLFVFIILTICFGVIIWKMINNHIPKTNKKRNEQRIGSSVKN